MNGQAGSSWFCKALRAGAALLAATADRLDAMRLAATGAVRAPEAEEDMITIRDRILSRYY